MVGIWLKVTFPATQVIVQLCSCFLQDCHGQGKYLKNDFFQVSEKSGYFVDGQGKLERTWKVREKSGNLKIISFGRQSTKHLFKRVKDVLSHEIV